MSACAEYLVELADNPSTRTTPQPPPRRRRDDHHGQWWSCISRYPSACCGCRQPIPRGSRIHYQVGTRRTRHEGCQEIAEG